MDEERELLRPDAIRGLPMEAQKAEVRKRREYVRARKAEQEQAALGGKLLTPKPRTPTPLTLGCIGLRICLTLESARLHIESSELSFLRAVLWFCQ